MLRQRPKITKTLIQPRFWNATVNLVVAEENNAGWRVSVSLCALWSKEMQEKNKYTPKVLLPSSKMCLCRVMDFSLEILRQTKSLKSLEIQFAVVQEAAHSRWLQITSYNYPLRARSISISKGYSTCMGQKSLEFLTNANQRSFHTVRNQYTCLDDQREL